MINTWTPASTQPQGEKGFWTKEVVCLTNLGNVHSLSFFKGQEDGVWQRPAAFLRGERVEWWISKPDGEYKPLDKFETFMEYLLEHESDIANQVNDFGTLECLFYDIIGRLPKAE